MRDDLFGEASETIMVYPSGGLGVTYGPCKCSCGRHKSGLTKGSRWARSGGLVGGLSGGSGPSDIPPNNPPNSPPCRPKDHAQNGPLAGLTFAVHIGSLKLHFLGFGQSPQKVRPYGTEGLPLSPRNPLGSSLGCDVATSWAVSRRGSILDPPQVDSESIPLDPWPI
jgi:hypothetical protein